MLYIASLEKRIEMLEHEKVELNRMFIELVYDIASLNEKTVSILKEYKTLIGKDSESK